MLWLLLLVGMVRGEVLDIHTRYEKGQKFVLEVKKRREDSKYKLANGRSVTSVQVTVIEASEAGFVLDWVPGETVWTELPLGNPALARLAAKAMDGVHLEMELGPQGGIRRMRNAPAVLAAVENVVSGLKEQIASQMKTAAEKKTFLETTVRTLPPVALASGVFQEAQIFCLLSGLSVDVERVVKSKFQTTHPLGAGVRISTDMEIGVSRIDREGKVAVVHMKQEYDRNGFVGMVRWVMSESGAGLERGERMPEIAMTDESEFALDLDYGWPRTITHVRRIEVGEKVKRVDTTEMSMKRLD